MKYKHIKAIIFDLDGTLVHTLPEYICRVVGRTLLDFNTVATENDMKRFWFEGDRDAIIRDIFHVELKDYWTKFHLYDDNQERVKYTRPYEDIRAVHELAKKFKLGIVTGAPTHIADLEIKLIGEHYFNSIVCAHEDNGYRIKPDPHGIIECMKLLNVTSLEALYVGNADEDMEAARNAHIPGIHIDRHEHKYTGIEPKHRITSLYELHDIVK
jgi:phosphoglycolate phosphatase